MLAGVAFSGYMVASVYMQLKSTTNTAAGRPYRPTRSVHDRHAASLRNDADDSELSWAYRHPAANRRRQGGDDVLVPPDPQVELPASAARLHVFRQAAVSSDSEVCSEIGK